VTHCVQSLRMTPEHSQQQQISGSRPHRRASALSGVYVAHRREWLRQLPFDLDPDSAGPDPVLSQNLGVIFGHRAEGRTDAVNRLHRSSTKSVTVEKLPRRRCDQRVYRLTVSYAVTSIKAIEGVTF
jgi:hypothetical protein